MCTKCGFNIGARITQGYFGSQVAHSTVNNGTDCSNRSDGASVGGLGASVGVLCVFSKCQNRLEGVFGVFRVRTRAQRVPRRNFGANGCETSEMEQIDADIPKRDDLLPRIVRYRISGSILDSHDDHNIFYS